MRITQDLVERFVVDGMIAHAERTLAASKSVGYRGRSTTELEELLGKLYDERRILMEDMMRVPLDRAGLRRRPL